MTAPSKLGLTNGLSPHVARLTRKGEAPLLAGQTVSARASKICVVR